MIRKALAWMLPMGLIGLLTCGLSGQTTKKASGMGPGPAEIARKTQQFLSNRRSLDGKPGAEHLYKAWRQGRSLQVAHAGRPVRGTSGSQTTAWQELGPKPLLAPFYSVGSSTPTLIAASGRVTAMAVDLKADPSGNTVYVGTAEGGLWKSSNGLAANPVFTPLTDALPASDIGSIAVDDSTQPATIYVGTGDQDFLQDSHFGIGILKSTDGGKTWTTTSWADNGAHTFFGLSVDRVVIDPANPRHLVAATAAALLRPGAPLTGAPFPETGIYASLDGGQTWTLEQQFTDQFGNLQNVTDLVVDPSSGSWYAAVSGMGVYSSPDGTTWTATASPLSTPREPLETITFERASLAVRGGTVYLLFSQRGDLPPYRPPSNPDTGIAQSTDGGKTWTTIAPPLAPPGSYPASFFSGQGENDQYIVAPPGSTGLIIGGPTIASTASVSGLSTAWTEATLWNSDIGPNYALSAAGSDGWYAGTGFGVWSTQDGGKTWADDNDTLGTEEVDNVLGIAVTPGQFLGTTGWNVEHSNDDGTTAWSAATNTQVFTQALAGDPANPTRVYAGVGEDLVISDDGGKTFAPVPSSNDSVGFLISEKDLGADTTSLITGAPWDLAIASCRVWVGPGYATPATAGWSPVSPDLTTDQPGTGCPPYDPATRTQPEVRALFPAPSDANTLYAMTSNGRVEGTTNLFAQSTAWNNLTVAPLPTDGSVPFTTMAVDPADAKTVYLGLGGFGDSHLFKSMDGGASWIDITGTLPAMPVNSIAIDPQTPNDVYVATDTGVFVATDGGVSAENWQQMGSGLPALPVLQIGFSSLGSRALLAATRGRGVWSIAPLDSTPDFALHLSPDFIAQQQGKAATLTASVDAFNGYTSTVQLSCSAPSSGCAISPASVDAGKSATVTIDPTALPSGGTVTISATDGTLTHTQSAQVQTSGLEVAPSLLHVALNWGSDEAPIVTGLNLSGPATLGCQNLPAGVTCGFGNAIDPANVWTNLYVSASSSAIPGTYAINVTATVGTETITAPVTVVISSFSLTSDESSVVVPDGTSPATFTIRSHASYSNPTPITLSCDGTVQCSFSPATIQTSNDLTTLAVTNLGPLSGPLTFNVIGTAGSDQEKLPLTVQPGTWSVKPEQDTVVIPPGRDFASFTLDYSATTFLPSPVVTCNVTGGLRCQAGLAGNRIGVQLSGLSSLPAGTKSYPFTVQVSVDDQQKSVPLTVSFATFFLSTKASSQQVLGGTDQASFTVDTSAVNNSTAAIDLTCSAPAGTTCSVAPATVNPGQSATLTATGLSATTPQNLPFQVTGSSGGVQESLAFQVQLADFALSSPTPTPTLASGVDTETFVIAARNLNAMRGPIQLGCDKSATVTCSFTPANMVAGTSAMLTVSGLSKATPVNDQIAIPVTGTAGTDVHTLALAVAVPDFAGTPTATGGSGSGNSQTVTAGQTAKYGLTYNSVNGFSGTVGMSCSGAPAQASCSVSPASFTLASGGTQAVTVSVATTGTSMLPAGPWKREPKLPGSPWVLVLAGLAGLACIPRRRRLMTAGVLMLGALLLSGCGGGGAASTPAPPAVQPTPSGTSTVTVTATSNGVAHTTQLTLKVQ